MYNTYFFKLKKNQLFFFVFFFQFLIFHNLNSQTINIEGTVYDTSGVKELGGASVFAVRMKDSLLLGYSYSNEYGKFKLPNLPIDTFTLFVEHPDFEKRMYFILGNPNELDLTIGKVILSTKVMELKDVIIYANKEPIYYRGDTLVYVADSFKVNDNAVVEDLLKKLPGIEVDKDGKITSQGQSISKVLVDGDEFFGSDPTIATKNLGAKGIESVKVYEKVEANKQDGDEEKIQVLDLTLKKDAKKGYFGKATLASDFDKYHEGEFLYNRYNGPKRFSVYSLASSTPRSGIGFADQSKFGISTFGSNSSTGVPQTLTTGFSFSNKFGKKKQGTVDIDYSLNDYQLKASTSSYSKYLLANDTSYFTDDSTFNNNQFLSHNLNIELEYQLDSLTKINIKPYLYFAEIKDDNYSISSFENENQQFQRSTQSNNNETNQNLISTNEFSIERKFKKEKRKLEFDHYLRYANDELNNILKTSNIYVDSVSTFLDVNQLRAEHSSSNFNRSRLIYSEPLSQFLTLMLNYQFSNTNSNQDVETRNFINGEYSDFNSLLSNSFKTLRNENKVGAKLKYAIKKLDVSSGVYLRNIRIENNNLTINQTINQNINNVLPYLNGTYKFSPSSRFRFDYETNSTAPSIEDLQLVQNNLNINRIVIGNPDLIPNYEHSLNLFYNNWNALTGRYLWTRINSSIIQNDFSSSVIYDNIGRSISQTINVNGNSNSDFYIGAGIPIYKRIVSLRPTFNMSLSKRTTLINNQKNITLNNSYIPSLTIDFRKDSLEFGITSEFSFNNPSNSLESVVSSRYTYQVYSGNIKWSTKYGFTYETDFTYTINSQRAVGYNINYFVWNMSLSKSFLKTNNLVLSVNAYDIFNQNISALRNINSNIITDNRTKIISRYFLLKLTYKFNNYKTHEEDAKFMWH